MQTTKDPLAMLKPGYGDRPPLQRYSEPPIILDSLNDSDAIDDSESLENRRQLDIAWGARDAQVAKSAYQIFK